jgi:hypothetical protein
MCDRGNKPDKRLLEASAKARTNTGTVKTDCPFVCTAKEDNAGKWVLVVDHPDHNHDFITDSSSHAAIRKLDKGQEFKEIVKAQKQVGILAKHTWNTLSDTKINTRDVLNERARVRRDDLRGVGIWQSMIRRQA